MYLTIKYLHMACALISGLGFVARGLLMMSDSPLRRHRWVRVLPHVNDTVLLSAAITLAVMAHQYPFHDQWLTAKVLGLFCYIALGMVAFRAGFSRPLRIAAWLSAMLVYGYIVSVAITKNPAWILGGA